MLLNTTRFNSESEKEVRKNSDPSDRSIVSKTVVTASRFSVDYWRDRVFRPTYIHDGESSEVLECYVQIQHRGRREKIGLGTNDKAVASRRAARFYATMREEGWDAAKKQLSPDYDSTPTNLITIGNLIQTVRPLAAVRPRTFEIYAYSLRKIAREAIGSKDTSANKYNPKSLDWRKNSDLLPLSKLTPNIITAWKQKILAEADQDPIAQQRARRNINSFARSARALFGRKILKKLTDLGVVLQTPLPFAGFEFEPQGNTKYVSKINAQELLRKAQGELAKTDPEAWKIILLALGAGLRRAEIDGLCWNQVNFDRCEIRVANHAFFQSKTVDSEGEIFVDPGLIKELKRFCTSPEPKPVVGGDIPFREATGAQHYRCQEIFERVTTWLRAQGVEGDRPLHTLRKEFGSIICAAADIHTASRQLRHSNLATTAAFYADHRKRVTVPVTDMLQRDKKLLPRKRKSARSRKARKPKKQKQSSTRQRAGTNRAIPS